MTEGSPWMAATALTDADAAAFPDGWSFCVEAALSLSLPLSRSSSPAPPSPLLFIIFRPAPSLWLPPPCFSSARCCCSCCLPASLALQHPHFLPFSSPLFSSLPTSGLWNFQDLCSSLFMRYNRVPAHIAVVCVCFLGDNNVCTYLSFTHGGLCVSFNTFVLWSSCVCNIWVWWLPCFHQLERFQVCCYSWPRCWLGMFTLYMRVLTLWWTLTHNSNKRVMLSNRDQLLWADLNSVDVSQTNIKRKCDWTLGSKAPHSVSMVLSEMFMFLVDRILHVCLKCTGYMQPCEPTTRFLSIHLILLLPSSYSRSLLTF